LPNTSVDHRHHRRVEFFAVHEHGERIPIWVFKPADALDSSAGLVMNLSDGGVQVLTSSAEPPDRPRYDIQLLLGEDAHVPRFRGGVARIWTRDAGGAGWISGFRFEDEHSSAEDFIRAYQAAAPERRWVRCLLAPQRR
jgi:hypothetical protein